MQASPGRSGIPRTLLGPLSSATNPDEHDVAPADPDALIPFGGKQSSRTEFSGATPSYDYGYLLAATRGPVREPAFQIIQPRRAPSVR